ncbi:phosphoglycerate kinase [Candidatus Falkowbacteria bacterium]|nr:phosphoglycerate kinase [Candidatus Falkowbacteria bacterium]
MAFKTILDMPDLKDKKVLLRLDLNVPLINQAITEDYKIKAALPSIIRLAERGAKIIVVSHLGEPLVKGKLVPKSKTLLTIKPIAFRLSQFLEQPVKFLPGQDLTSLKKQIDQAKESIIVLDNLRFWPGELDNDSFFAQELAGLADFYINDAFAVSHRLQASVAAVKDFLPSFAGLLLEQEVVNLSRALKPKQPLIVVLGGAKISSKVNLIRHLGQKATKILVGGGLANNFLVAHGHQVGQSLIDKESVDLARQLIKELGNKLIVPVDVIVAGVNGQPILRLVSQVGGQENILDIGPATIKEFSRQIKLAKTIVWNGPLGKFEDEHYKNGTLFIAREIAWQSRGVAFGLVGGGETVAALQMTKMAGYVDWVSTAGGAMLTFLGGEAMPGLTKII